MSQLIVLRGIRRQLLGDYLTIKKCAKKGGE